MAKAGRGQTRRDSKRRVLRPGESVRADGKYQYKYHIDGKMCIRDRYISMTVMESRSYGFRKILL